MAFYLLDIEYNGTMKFFSNLPPGQDPTFDDIGYKCTIDDCRKHGHSEDDIMHNISHRLHRTTKMNPIPRFVKYS